MTALAGAGVPVGVFLAPILPGITNGPGEIEALIGEAAAHGAGYVMASPVRISEGFAEPLLQSVARDFPEMHARYECQVRSRFIPATAAARLNERVSEARDRVGLGSGPPRRPSRRPPQLGLDL